MKIMRSITRYLHAEKLLTRQTNITPRFFSTILSRDNKTDEAIQNENWLRRCELAIAYRGFEKYNFHEGVCNHLTVQAPSLHQEEPIILVIPYGIYWAEVTPQCLVGININTAELVEGVDEPDITAQSIHRGIYRYRPHVNSVQHSHATYSTILSVLKDPELKMIHQNCARFYDRIAYDIMYDGIARDGFNDESERLGKSIGNKDVLLMGNHGLTTVGSNVAQAFDRHYYFEKAAQNVILAYQTGQPLSYLKKEAIESCRAIFDDENELLYCDKHFQGVQQHLMKVDPTFLK